MFKLVSNFHLLVFSLLLVSSTLYAEVTYDELFPLYVQPCALTQIKKVGKSAGGSPGHSIIYIKGMCRDKTVKYPRVRVCDKSVNLKTPDAGTFISVNKNFKNTNWIAFDGKRMGFQGELNSNDPVNEETKAQVMKNAISSGAFQGVEVLDKWTKSRPKGMTAEESVARLSLATDYAVSLGRISYCNLIPITPNQLQAMVHYLNQINAPFVFGNEKYKWDGLTNNCTHVVQNTLASARIRSAKATDHNAISGLFDTAVPANLILTNAEKGHDGRFLSVEELYRIPKVVKSYQEYGRPAFTHGTLFQVLPMHTYKNTLYRERETLFTLDVPLFTPRKNKLKSITEDPEYIDLLTHLKLYQEKYTEAIRALPNLDDAIKNNSKLDTDAFKEFYETHSRWLVESLQDVKNKIQILEQQSSKR